MAKQVKGAAKRAKKRADGREGGAAFRNTILVLEGTNIPIVMAAPDGSIRGFTLAAKRLFRLAAGDIGRQLGAVELRLRRPNLEAMVRRVGRSRKGHEEEIQDGEGRWYLMRLRPYLTAGKRLEGVLLTFIDIDELKRSVRELEDANAYSEAIIATIREPLVVLDEGWRVVTANAAYDARFSTSAGQTIGRSFFRAGGVRWDAELLVPAFERALHGNAPVEVLEVDVEIRRVGVRTLFFRGRPLAQQRAGKFLLLTIDDITERKNAEAELLRDQQVMKENEGRLRELATDLILAQEQERRQVARSLHDDLNQKMAILAIEAESLAQRLPESEGDLLARLRSLHGHIAGISDDLRRTAQFLHPSMVEHLGLGTALRSLAGEFNRAGEIAVRCRHGLMPTQMPQVVALCLYRVAQRSLRNIAERGRASKVFLVLTAGSEEVRLTITESGGGGGAIESEGLETVGMRERVRAVGGTIRFFTKAGGGSRIAVEVPLPKELV